MGIYGALSTAVTGLQAQSFALENISGNIANSQTTGYKRVETSFEDLIPDGKPTQQTAGSVVGFARATNNVQGDISSSPIATNMAINGNGFFVVQQKTGESDGHSTFSGGTFYTRRGDFDVDKEGYLVNQAGYYLEGLPIDPATGNVSSSVPSVIKISNQLLPALASTKIDYQLNLPQEPQVANTQAGVPSSSLLHPSSFLPTVITTPATATGTAALNSATLANTVVTPVQSMSVKVGGTTTTFDFYDSTAGAYTGANQGIDIATADVGSMLGDMQAKLRAADPTGSASATIGLVGGNVQIGLGSNLTDSMTVTNGATGLGLAATQTVAATGVAPTGPVNAIKASDSDEFINQSIEGGAVTVYSSNGSPADVQFRWAKTDSAEAGGTDTWNLFYLSNSGATGATPMWTNVGTDYKFAADGSMSPKIEQTTIHNLNVNGVALGDMVLQHGANGVTQSFTDSSGTASVTDLTQNGYAAGKFTSVAVDDSGRVVASYSNGQQVNVAQVVTANFNGVNALKRMDGGAFAQTTESGPPVLSTNPAISGSSLEASNTDISSEFSSLIVTQQAYAAGTKIVTTANDMLQQALNMIR